MLYQVGQLVCLTEVSVVRPSYLAQRVLHQFACRSMYHFNIPREVCPQFDVKTGEFVQPDAVPSQVPRCGVAVQTLIHRKLHSEQP
jgi:hypothetical protein